MRQPPGTLPDPRRRPASAPARRALRALALAAACSIPAIGQAGEPPSDFINALAREIVNPPWKDGEALTERLRLRLPEGLIWTVGSPPADEAGRTCRRYESTSIATGVVRRITACDMLPSEASASVMRDAPQVVLDGLFASVGPSAYAECGGGSPEIRSREPLDGMPARVGLLTCPSPGGTERVIVAFALGHAMHSIEISCQGPAAAVEAAMPELLDVVLGAVPCSAGQVGRPCADENAPAVAVAASPPAAVAQAAPRVAAAPEAERLRVNWRGVTGWVRAAPPDGHGAQCISFDRTTADGAQARLNVCSVVPDAGSEAGLAIRRGTAEAFLDTYVAELRAPNPACPGQETDLVSTQGLGGMPSRLLLIVCPRGDATTMRVSRIAVGGAVHQVDAMLRGDMLLLADAFAEVSALMSALEPCNAASDAACPSGIDEPPRAR